jgi:ribonuclease J
MGDPSGSVRLIPLGGIGEIGKNMLVVEDDRSMVVVDAGITFPREQMPGVDLVAPDFSYVLERREKLRGVVLTHGHEDHIGALPFLLREVQAPVYGTRLTLGFARNRLEEHVIPHPVRFEEITPRQELRFGDLRLEFFRVCHSVADGVGFALHTPGGTVLHTGDFKIDFTPVHGHRMDFYKIAEYGERGVLLLMSDSTNAESKGYTPSERELRGLLFDTLANAGGRVIISTFASNIHRIQQMFEVCARTGKKVCVLGRSMERNVSLARELGHLRFSEDLLVPLERVRSYPRPQVLLLTTGTQGEPMSALAQIAADRHKQVSVERGDTVILSASIIPGNERTVSDIVNSLFNRGAYVYYEGFEDLHVSGHASREELKLMIALARPAYFIPVHGELRHLMHHSTLAKEMGIQEQNIILARNGDVIEVQDGRVLVTGRIGVGSTCVNGKAPPAWGGPTSERFRIAQDGILIVVVPVTREDGGIMEPEISTRGMAPADRPEELVSRARGVALDAARRCLSRHGVNTGQLKGELRVALEEYLHRETSRRPVVVPIVVEL